MPPLGPETPRPYKVFCSYAHEDEKWRAQLEKHLSGLQRQGLITWFCDRQIRVGDEWDRVLRSEVEQAQIFLLLVTADFLSSPYCYEIELQRALDRHAAGEAVVVPIAVDHCDWKGASFERFQAVPDPATPVAQDPSRLLTEVATKLRDLVESIPRRAVPTISASSRTARPVPQLLPYLCNRSLQEQALQFSLSVARDKPRRPLFLVIHGAREEAHDGFLARLEKHLLPRLLQLGDKPVRRIPMEWPGAWRTRSAQELFGPLLANSIEACEPFAPVTRMAELLSAAEGLALVILNVDTVTWAESGAQTLQRALHFWNEWPDLPPGRSLSIVLTVKYGSGSAPRPKELLRYREANRRIRAVLKHLNPVDYANLVLVVLPELLPVAQGELENFIRSREVQTFCDPQRELDWVKEVRSLYENMERIPMEKLVPSLVGMLQRCAR